MKPPIDQPPTEAVPGPTVPKKPSRRLWRSREEREAAKATALVQRERALIEAQRARDQREMESLEAEREKSTVREDLNRIAKAEQDELAEQRSSIRQRISRAVVLASANVGVNAVAVLGQVLALTLSLHWEWYAAVPLALVVESVAVNIGYIAHDKLINGYSAGWLRTLSYGIGAGVGWFNYDHNHGQEETAAFAAVFGACSLLSPVLWQIYSQWRHWQTLRDQGLLEARAPKFSKLRWIIPSLRGETWRAFKVAIAEGIQSPEIAITEVRARTVAGTAEKDLRQAREVLIRTQADALQLTLSHLAALYHDLDGEDPKATAARVHIARFVQRFRPIVPALELAGPVPGSSEDETDPEPEPEPAKNPKRPSDDDNRKTRQRITRVIRAGKPVPTKAEVAGWRGFSEKWGWDRIQDAKSDLAAEGWTFPDRGQPVPPDGSPLVPAQSLNGSTLTHDGEPS